ncbi:MAG TPA: YceI family protein [Pyrinomonadaceae bacterium]|jgi:polyisoprenoid-binding protein YceI|nr:YceI family protein [Pyrinomonadaceae bacterium]
MDVNETITVRYRIDARQSRFVVRAEASGLLSVFGHNPVIAVRGFGGDARFNADDPRQTSLLMLVQADSLAVVGEVSEKDRLEIERMMRAEVLETARYPEIVFMSRSIALNRTAENNYRARITGSLSLHGATRDEVIAAQVAVNGERLRAQGEFTLRQSDYNIKPVSAMGGTLKVRDEVKLSFDISALA